MRMYLNTKYFLLSFPNYIFFFRHIDNRLTKQAPIISHKITQNDASGQVAKVTSIKSNSVSETNNSVQKPIETLPPISKLNALHAGKAVPLKGNHAKFAAEYKVQVSI